MHWLDIRTSEVNSDLGNIPDTSEHLINAHQPSHDKHQSLLEERWRCQALRGIF